MKTQAITRFGDPLVFSALELPVPELKPGYVLIRVLATSVNPVDTKIRSGMMAAIAPQFPAILHGDVAGIIEKVGANVTTFQVGDEVFGCAGGVKGEGGALAEYMLADSRLIAKKPASITMSQAAALPLVCITAWEGLFEKNKIAPQQKVLVHAGIGGVGHVAVQLAKWAKADVYTTVSTPEKAKIAENFGATVINYREESVEAYVKKYTNGEGFDVVFDTVGGNNIDLSLSAVAQYGHVITIQAKSSHDLTPLYLKSASLDAVLMLLPLLYNKKREKHGEILTQVANLVDQGFLKPLIHPQQFSFDDVSKAHALLESGEAVGKVIINIT